MAIEQLDTQTTDALEGIVKIIEDISEFLVIYNCCSQDQANQFRALLNSNHQAVISEFEELNGLLKEFQEEIKIVKLHMMRMYERVDFLTQRADNLESLIAREKEKLEREEKESVNEA